MRRFRGFADIATGITRMNPLHWTLLEWAGLAMMVLGGTVAGGMLQSRAYAHARLREMGIREKSRCRRWRGCCSTPGSQCSSEELR
jgi:hypothetical protein